MVELLEIFKVIGIDIDELLFELDAYFYLQRDHQRVHCEDRQEYFARRTVYMQDMYFKVFQFIELMIKTMYRLKMSPIYDDYRVMVLEERLLEMMKQHFRATVAEDGQCLSYRRWHFSYRNLSDEVCKELQDLQDFFDSCKEEDKNKNQETVNIEWISETESVLF